MIAHFLFVITLKTFATIIQMNSIFIFRVALIKSRTAVKLSFESWNSDDSAARPTGKIEYNPDTKSIVNAACKEVQI